MNLKERMELYERVYSSYIPIRMPIIIRVDGNDFHTLLKKAEKPFDDHFAYAMDSTAVFMLNKIQNARMAYIQSDEISLLLIDYDRFDSQQWFGGKFQKMISISAGFASAHFSLRTGKITTFDSRIIPIPERDVMNYFIWRQQDATRNSIQMVAQSFYSHKELLGKSTKKMQEMIFKKGKNWGGHAPYWRRGRIVTKKGTDGNIPIFSKNPEYLEKFLKIGEE